MVEDVPGDNHDCRTLGHGPLRIRRRVLLRLVGEPVLLWLYAVRSLAIVRKDLRGDNSFVNNLKNYPRQRPASCRVSLRVFRVQLEVCDRRSMTPSKFTKRQLRERGYYCITVSVMQATSPACFTACSRRLPHARGAYKNGHLDVCHRPLRSS
jgi:hypothetical protein